MPKAWESDGLGVSQLIFIFIFRIRHRIRRSYFLVLPALHLIVVRNTMKMAIKRLIIGGILVGTFAGLYFGYRSMIFEESSIIFPDQCPLHDVPIESERRKNQRVAILVDYDWDYTEAYPAAKQSLFPYSGHGLWDGGDHPSKWIRWIDSKFCPKCRSEALLWNRQWVEQHREDQ